MKPNMRVLAPQLTKQFAAVEAVVVAVMELEVAVLPSHPMEDVKDKANMELPPVEDLLPYHQDTALRPQPVLVMVLPHLVVHPSAVLPHSVVHLEIAMEVRPQPQ